MSKPTFVQKKIIQTNFCEQQKAYRSVGLLQKVRKLIVLKEYLENMIIKDLINSKIRNIE